MFKIQNGIILLILSTLHNYTFQELMESFGVGIFLWLKFSSFEE